jgi:hypothetical protein
LLPTFVSQHKEKSRIAHGPIKYFEAIKSPHKAYEFFALDSNRAACEIRDIEFARLLCSNVPQNPEFFGTPYRVHNALFAA